MKQSLNLRLSQHLALTPQLQQSIRLLQLSTLELQQEVEQMLELNPFLEPDEEPAGAGDAASDSAGDSAAGSGSDASGDAAVDAAAEFAPESRQPGDEAGAPAGSDESARESGASAATESGAGSSEPEAGELRLDAEDWRDGARSADSAESPEAAEPGEGIEWDQAGSGNSQSGGEGDDEFDPLGLAHAALDLRAHLRAQLAGRSLSPNDRAAAEAIIDSLDDDGYLPETPEELAAELAPQSPADDVEALGEALRVGLRLVQSFDPAGVGASCLAECMRLQLLRLPADDIRELALALCTQEHLALLSRRDWKRLARALQVDEAALRAAQQLIARLDPRPGARFGLQAAQSVVPDVIAQRTGTRWRAVLNPEVLPRLRIHSLYAELLRRSRDGNGLSGQLQEARWFVRNVQQRFETIERVAQAVVERQQAFFSDGELGMRPLVLREIADELGLHESTISRVTTQKFLLTPHGTFELKYFFGSGLATDSGASASSTAVRALIRGMVQQENPASPLSDGEIAERLAAQGISVARRTVAKYREALRIPPTAQRKAV